MSSEPKADEEPEVAAPPHAVDAAIEAPPTDVAAESAAVSSSTSPSVTPELGPGAESSETSPPGEAGAAESSILGSGPRMAGKRVVASEPAPELAASAPKRRLRWGRALLVVLAILILWPPLSVLALKVIPPPVTILMVERLAQGQGVDKHWRSLGQIAPSLPLAVIAAEDAKFCEHEGFDWDAIRTAEEHNARSEKVRGGSTISQQTAKNVFLWPARDYLRKGLEAGYTVLIEKLWGKRRILEAYLNVVEWGPGLYGAQAAAQRYFHEDASALTPQQSARLAAILPSPLKWKAVNPGRYVMRRSRKIGANAQLVRTDDLAWCVRR